MIACMGGFCPKRDACADYHLGGPIVSERLCAKGSEDPRPMRQPVSRNPPVDVPDEQLPAPLRGGALEVF